MEAFDLAAYGFDIVAEDAKPVGSRPPHAAAGTCWRDKYQNLYKADGNGLFIDPESRLPAIDEGWTGDKPGHGLIQVENESAFAEVYPPSINALRIVWSEIQQRKGSQYANSQLATLGVKVTKISTKDNCPEKADGWTWAAYKLFQDSAKVNFSEPGQEEAKQKEIDAYVAEEVAKTDSEVLPNECVCEADPPCEKDCTKPDDRFNQWVAAGSPDTPVTAEDRAALNYVAESEDNPQDVDFTPQAETPQQIAAQEAAAIDAPQLPASVMTEDGEIVDVRAWFRIAGIETDDVENFRVDSEERFDWFVNLVRRLQHEIEDISVMAARRIKDRIMAIAGLTWYYKLDLYEYCEPRLERWKSDSKEGAKSPHKKGDYKSKSVKATFGGAYWSKTGGCNFLLPNETKSWLHDKPAEELPKYGAKKTHTIVVPPGFDIVIFDPQGEEVKAHEFLNLNVDYRTAMSFSRKKVAALVEAGEEIPGTEKEAANPLGMVKIGLERGWSWLKKQKEFKDSIKAISMKGEDSEADDDESEAA